jgi:hypothetical protein
MTFQAVSQRSDINLPVSCYDLWLCIVEDEDVFRLNRQNFHHPHLRIWLTILKNSRANTGLCYTSV